MRATALALSIAMLTSVSMTHAESQGDAPVTTLRVDADIKQLVFDWRRVPGASYYQLEFKANPTAAFVPLGNRLPAQRTHARVNIAVHQLDWANARYRVSACDAWGCRRSADIAVAGEMLDAIGYFKASNTDSDDQFGRSVKLSLDGNTLVVAAQDDSNATGVNGDQADNSSTNSGAVYVFRRVGSQWRQEAYLKAGVNQSETYFGMGYPISAHNVGVSSDGSVLAVGSSAETVNGVRFAGAVYVFARSADGTWQQVQRLALPTPQQWDFYGMSVDLSSDAGTLKVTSLNPRDGEGNAEGQTWIYARSASGFTLDTHIPSTPNDFCSSIMSGDAGTLINFCYSYENPGPMLKTFKRVSGEWVRQPDLPFTNFSSQIPAISHDGRRLAFRWSAGLSQHEAHVFRWTDAGWVADGIIRAPEGATAPYHVFANAMTFSANGSVLAVAEYANSNGGAGVLDAPVAGDPEDVPTGAVYLYRRQSGAWQLTRMVKSPYPGAGYGFGMEVSLSGNGRTLAVGSVWEDSGATGVNGDATDTSSQEAGAVFLY